MSGEGHLLVFNNGGGRKPVEYSSVDEFVPPTDKDGNYVRPKRGPFGPAKPLWSYTAPNKKDFYSWFISGAQRLPNGNTLINAGAVGIVFEVTPEKETVWKFSNPFKPVASTPPAANRRPKRFEALASPCLGWRDVTPCGARGEFSISHYITVSSPSGGLRRPLVEKLQRLEHPPRVLRAASQPPTLGLALQTERDQPDRRQCLHGLRR